MVTEQMPDEENSQLRYSVRLLIRHPNMDPARITETLGLTPHHSAVAGSERKAPDGSRLPGRHQFSVWSYSFDVEGKRRFFSDVEKMLHKLQPHKALLTEMDDSGGTAILIIHLPGDVNIGSTLGWREMARLGELRISLGIEVFPIYN